MSTFETHTDSQDQDDAPAAQKRLGTADIAGAARTGHSEDRPSSVAGTGEDRVALFSASDSSTFEDRWTSVQTQFVDDPRDAVVAADELVAEVMQALATRFAEQKETLEHGWQDEGAVDTEELRQAMRHYRSFFHRLLAA